MGEPISDEGKLREFAERLEYGATQTAELASESLLREAAALLRRHRDQISALEGERNTALNAMQICADRAGAAEGDATAGYRAAAGLAALLHSNHYPYAEGWKPLEDTIGVITQIDNMVAGIVARAQAAEQALAAARAGLSDIKRLKPEPIPHTPFETGPAALLRRAQEIATETLAKIGGKNG